MINTLIHISSSKYLKGQCNARVQRMYATCLAEIKSLWRLSLSISFAAHGFRPQLIWRKLELDQIPFISNNDAMTMTDDTLNHLI